MATTPIRKDVQIIPEPCNQRETAQNWKTVRQHINNLLNTVEELAEQFIDIGDVIIQTISNTTLLNIFQVTYGTSAGRRIYFELDEDKPGVTAEATVLQTFNGDDPGSPVIVTDLTLRWPYALKGAQGIAVEAFDGNESVWLIEQCWQLVKWATAYSKEDHCGGEEGLEIENFVGIEEGEWVQQYPEGLEPNEVGNPLGIPILAGRELRLRRINDSWEVEYAELSEYEVLQSIDVTDHEIGMTTIALKGHVCGGEGGDRYVVHVGTDCDEEA